jgi:Ca-activated chloride channel family protein
MQLLVLEIVAVLRAPVAIRLSDGKFDAGLRPPVTEIMASKFDGGALMRSSDGAWWFLFLWTALASAILISTAWAQTPAAAPAATTPPTPVNGSPAGQQMTPQQTAPAGNEPAQAPPSDQNPASQNPITSEPGSGDQGGMFVFKKQVEEVVLHATVVDEEHHPVSGLDRNAFSVLENGVSEPITSFRREDIPVAMGIVVDNSGSMRDKRDKVSQAVLNLIRASNPQDEIFVVNFSQRSYLDQDFTSDVNLLQAALHQVSAKGSTALYDAIVASAVHLGNNANLEKKVLLVITDGQDNMSEETLQEASRRLEQANGPTLYAIGLLGSGLQRSGRDALQDLAGGTGGVAYFPESLDQVDNITRSVAHDIRSQYRLAYKPKNQDVKPQFQEVHVEAHAPGYGKLTVRTRSGYYPPESGH